MYVIHNTEISHFTEADSEFIIDLHQTASKKKKEKDRKEGGEKKLPIPQPAQL